MKRTQNGNMDRFLSEDWGYFQKLCFRHLVLGLWWLLWFGASGNAFLIFWSIFRQLCQTRS